MRAETRKRIKAYQDALPELRERVIGVVLLLAMSVVMMTSASFAWLTISRRPEVSAVSTTLAANGNLEIALAPPDGSRPPESQVGDSSAAQDQSVVAANLTWGNLINLSDASYGLENLTLRPAQLNTAALNSSPLYGASYTTDGRIEKLTSNFGYTTWNLPDGNNPGYFGVSNALGVRAISSTKTEAIGADKMYFDMVEDAESKNLAAGAAYTSIVANKEYMQSLANMMGVHLTANLNSGDATLGNPTCDIADIINLRDMYQELLVAFDLEAEALAALVNLQQLIKNGLDENLNIKDYTKYTKEMIYATTKDEIIPGFFITTLTSSANNALKITSFIKDRNTIASDLEKLEALAAGGTNLTYKDSKLNLIVNNLTNVDKCTVDGTPVSGIGASNAFDYLGKTCEARITNGILYNFEYRTGAHIEVKGMQIKATAKRMGITVPATVKANIKTSAPADRYLFNDDLTATKAQKGSISGGKSVAQDTYGLAVDFWVRTNAHNSYLVLGGNVLTESHEVPATGKDAEGNTVNIYTVSQTLEETDSAGKTTTTTVSVDVYCITETVDGVEQTTWYDAQSHTAIELEEGQTPLQKMETVTTVIGYEGDNRVWDESKQLSTDATTQGSGSCYVYYADTPEDQARSLKLLEAFRVAFVGADGSLLATALMDTERVFEENGRVTVPMVLDPTTSIELGEDYTGETSYGIMPLIANEATRVTAIVYLDGTKLTNEDVLAASSIQGKLNIQFGSSADLIPMSDEDLEDQERSVSATVSQTSFDYDTHQGDMTTRVTVTVTGNEPAMVKAFFLRTISSTQGTREETMTFTKVDGQWVSDYTFTTPGSYVLRSVELDGVEYDLKGSLPTVNISGFAVANLSCDDAEGSILNLRSAANSYNTTLRLKFATDDASKLPRSVQGRFLRADGTAVNGDFTLDATTQIWNGNATFLTSGGYTMEYLLLDGEYSPLDKSKYLTANLTLGMRVRVYTTSTQNIMWEASYSDPANAPLLNMQMVITDNAGNEMPGLQNVKLIYNRKGSSFTTIDADLTWNGSYYVGAIPASKGPGIWQFSHVTVGTDTLTNATSAPSFTIMSPEPPEYYDHNTPAYQYKPNNDAVMNAQISNSEAAQVQALIVKSDGTEYWVDGIMGDTFTTMSVTQWGFKIPTDVNGYQDGHWTLKALKLWDVFSADGVMYTQEEPLEIDVSNTNNMTKVVSRVNVKFVEDKSQNFGKAADGKVTGAFMDTYTISGIAVDITDFEGAKIEGITDVTLTFTYGNNSATYGGYTGTSLNNATADFTIALTNDGSNTRFVQTESKAIQYAGSYTTTFGFKVNGVSKNYAGDNLPANTPKFTVSSVAPTVKITNAHYGSSKSENPATFTDTTTTVTKYEYEGSCGVTNYKQPSVVITLDKIGKASGASLQFTRTGGGDVMLYTSNGGTTATDTYQWTGNGACTRWVGYFRSVTGGDTYTATGTLVATKLVLTFNNMSFEVDIPDITINNPS